MNTRRWAYVLAAAALAYMVFAMWQAVAFIRSGSVVGAILGIAVLTLPLLGVWLIWRELEFAASVQELADELAAAGQLPPELERRPSGRPTPEAAQAEFDRCLAMVTAEPLDPAAWFAMSLAYDAGSDRKRARAAMRHAVALHSGELDHPVPPELGE